MQISIKQLFLWFELNWIDVKYLSNRTEASLCVSMMCVYVYVCECVSKGVFI